MGESPEAFSPLQRCVHCTGESVTEKGARASVWWHGGFTNTLFPKALKAQQRW